MTESAQCSLQYPLGRTCSVALLAAGDTVVIREILSLDQSGAVTYSASVIPSLNAPRDADPHPENDAGSVVTTVAATRPRGARH